MVMVKKHSFGALLTGLILAAGSVATHAGVIFSPVNATASSTVGPSYDIGNTIDQSGLSAGFISGVTDFDTYIASLPTHTLIAENNEWFTEFGVTRATVTYDLGSAMTFDRLALWNEEFSGFGVGDVGTSLDGIGFAALTTINPVDSPISADYGAQVFGLGVTTARYVQFELSDCPQPDGDPSLLCGIGEVAFELVDAANVPAPATLALLGLGLLGLRLRQNA